MSTSRAMQNKERGLTLIEILFYVAILAMLVLAVLQALIPLGRSFRTLSANTSINTTAQVALERMVREIRGGTSVDLANSTLGSSPGVLQLNTLDSGGNATTVQFYLSGTTLRLKEAGIDSGPLAPSSARVTSLIFRKITTSNSQAVKVEITVESGSGASYISKKFYTTAVLRGSYPST